MENKTDTEKLVELHKEILETSQEIRNSKQFPVQEKKYLLHKINKLEEEIILLRSSKIVENKYLNDIKYLEHKIMEHDEAIFELKNRK